MYSYKVDWLASDARFFVIIIIIFFAQSWAKAKGHFFTF